MDAVHPRNRGDKFILYVEDDPAAVRLFQVALKQLSIVCSPQVFVVEDGQQAIEFLTRMAPYENAPQPDLVLLDLNLPRRDGFSILEEIRQFKPLAQLPVLVFSSSLDPADQARARSLGSLDVLYKPNTFDEFVKSVQSICSWLPL